MTVYAWPATRAWEPNTFEMRIIPNVLTFTSPYTKSTQTVDLLGERWQVRLDLPDGNSRLQGAAIEAFFDRLRGPSNLVSMWNLSRPAPQGTLRDGLTAAVVNGSLAAVTVVNGSAVTVPTIYGTPSVQTPVLQLANTMRMTAAPGYTVRAGDHLGFLGQNTRVMVDAVTDGSGNLDIEFLPRARVDWPVGTPAVWDKPTANFMLKADGVPVAWHARSTFDGQSAEFIEAY